MKIGILGSGTVGQELAKGFRDRGDSVMIGTRNPSKLSDWCSDDGKGVDAGLVSDVASFGELIVLATAWNGVAPTLESAGDASLRGKIVIDVTNPLKFQTEGDPPVLALAYPDSAGKRVQELLPESRVVKCFNTVNARLMAHPRTATESPDMFLAGDDSDAKQTVSRIAGEWGWRVHDIGGIEQSYILEAFALLWIVYGCTHDTWTHVFKLMNT